MHTSYKKISLKAQITLLEVWIVFFIKTLFKTQEQTDTHKKKIQEIFYLDRNCCGIPRVAVLKWF